MRIFDVKVLFTSLALIVLGGILSFILCRFVFFGPIAGEGLIITLGALTFFGVILFTTIFTFQWAFVFRFFRKTRKRYTSREELYAEERNSSLNYIGVFWGGFYGFVFGIVFAIFYAEISLLKGVGIMTLYGVLFGIFMLFLIKREWLSFFYLAKARDYYR